MTKLGHLYYDVFVEKIEIDPNVLKKLYYDDELSQARIAKWLNVTQYVVSSRMRELGLKTRPKHHKLSRQKYKINESCLKEITPDVAWVLGWMLADGFVVRSDNCFGIRLAAYDVQVLEEIKEFFGYSGPILNCTTKLKKTGKVYPGKLLKISSKKLRQRFIDLGIAPSKSGREKYLACINNTELHRSFIRGVFEGDGSLLEYTDRRRFQIVGTKELLLSIQDQLVKYISIRRTKLQCQNKESNHYLLQYSGRLQVPKIANWIYSGAHKKLDRKFNVYKKMKGEL